MFPYNYYHYYYYSQHLLYCHPTAPAIAAVTTVSIYSACVFHVALKSSQSHSRQLSTKVCDTQTFMQTKTNTVWSVKTPQSPISATHVCSNVTLSRGENTHERENDVNALLVFTPHRSPAILMRIRFPFALRHIMY